MSFDHMQKAWHSQDAGAKVPISADVLLREVWFDQVYFRAIFWCDVFVAGFFYALTAYFLYVGVHDGDWTFILMGFACFGVASFMLVDRLLLRRRRTTARDPLKRCIEASLMQVKHQIWLDKNVFWSYVLPLAAGFTVVFGHAAWRWRNPAFLLPLAGVIVAFWILCWLSRFGLRKSLEPRRRELETLLASLNENPE
jgi:hypothetical protein